MTVLVNGSEIVLSGTVGDLFWEDSFTAAEVVVALAQVGRDQDVTLRINSPGGIATEGAAIHAALMAHRGKKTVIVEGAAMSAASVIAMAGDEIVMALGAVMMIHDPSGFTFGTVADHEKEIEALTALATAMAGIYAERSGRTVEQCRADMREEIWLTPDAAVEQGYATRVQARAANNNDEPREPTAFDFRLYTNPPERLVALADARGWSRRQRPLAASAAPSGSQEHPMPNETKAGDPAAKTTFTQADIDAAVALATRSMTSNADASEIARLCAEGGVPAMAASLLREGASLEEAKTRITSAADITKIVADARRMDPTIPADQAQTFISAGKTADQAARALLDRMATAQESTEVRSHVRLDDPATASAAGPADVVTAMKRRHGVAA